MEYQKVREEAEAICPQVLKGFEDGEMDDVLIRAMHRFHPDVVKPASLNTPYRHTKTDVACRVVAALAGYGATKREIANVLGLSEGIITKYYSGEFEGGRDIANTQVKKKIFDLCMEGDTKMLQLFAKTQLGWKETRVTEANVNVTLTKEQRDAMAKAAVIDVSEFGG